MGLLEVEDSSSENKIHSKSMELTHKSIDLRADVQKLLPKQNPLIGYGIMMVAVLGITANHLFAKIAYFNNSKLK